MEETEQRAAAVVGGGLLGCLWDGGSVAHSKAKRFFAVLFKAAISADVTRRDTESEGVLGRHNLGRRRERPRSGSGLFQ